MRSKALLLPITPTCAAAMEPARPPDMPTPCSTEAKALVPHRHEHVHWPLAVDPVPATTLAEAAATLEVAAAAAAVVVEDVAVPF